MIVRTLLKLYLVALIIFTIFRLILLGIHFEEASHAISLIPQALLMGLRFDMVILAYIFALPMLVAVVGESYSGKNASKAFIYFAGTMCLLAFIVSTIDIIYFGQYAQRLNYAVFHWIDSPWFVIRLVVQDIAFLLPLIGILIIGILWMMYVHYLASRSEKNALNWIWKLGLVFFLFLSMRGRIDIKSPIRVGTAYFSNHHFINELGLNPNFTLIRSVLDQRQIVKNKLSLTDNERAANYFRQWINSNSADPCSIERQVRYTAASRKNIILILMESMGKCCFTSQMKLNTTPFLDSLSDLSRVFSPVFSNGIHTFNGIFSTLYSFPSISTYHPLKFSEKKYHGIPAELKKLNYTNLFFTTHDGQFDNIEGFLYKNDFDKVFSDDEYKFEDKHTNLGVVDDVMLRHAADLMDRETTPFFSVLLTSSHHTPFYTPPYFKREFSDDRTNAIHYADAALRIFIERAKKSPWYQNSIFVFVADHGIPQTTDLPVALSYNSIPFILFDPSVTVGNLVSGFGTQIDVMPTILSYLNLSYTNNTFGVDLNNSKRDFAIYNYDDRYAVIDSSLIFVQKYDRSFAGVYSLKNAEAINCKELSQECDKLKNAGQSILQFYSNFEANCMK